MCVCVFERDREESVCAVCMFVDIRYAVFNLRYRIYENNKNRKNKNVTLAAANLIS
jgi:hypothetical protein